MKIEWLPAALGNRDSQIAYIAERNPSAAIRMGDALEAAIARLADYPESAPPGRVPGTRELSVAGTPYIVVYRVEPETVVILRLLHGAEGWPPEGGGPFSRSSLMRGTGGLAPQKKKRKLNPARS